MASSTRSMVTALAMSSGVAFVVQSSAQVEGAPVFPGRAFTARSLWLFEDSAGAAKADWDYNDFVMLQESTCQHGSPARVEAAFTPLFRGSERVQSLVHEWPGEGPWEARIARCQRAGGPCRGEVLRGSGAARIAIFEDTRDGWTSGELSLTGEAGGPVTVSLTWLTSPELDGLTCTGSPSVLLPYGEAASSRAAVASPEHIEVAVSGPWRGAPLPLAFEVTEPTLVIWPKEGVPIWDACSSEPGQNPLWSPHGLQHCRRSASTLARRLP